MDDISERLPAVRKAANCVGGVKRLAGILGISRAAVYQWKQVPADQVRKIERATGGKVTRYELRPDLYMDDDDSSNHVDSVSKLTERAAP